MFLRRALTRTSVGNKKYEGKDEYEKRNGARRDGFQTEILAFLDDAVGAAAMRHATDLKRCVKAVSTTFSRKL